MDLAGSQVEFQTAGSATETRSSVSPRDRVMRRVNWNLANCDATVQKLLTWQVLTISMVWSWRFSRRQCVIDNVHSTVTWPSRFHCLRCVINKPTTVSCVYHLSTDDLLWRNFLSPQCRNCSRDPDRAHLGSTHSSQVQDFTWLTSVQNLKSLALAVAEILHGV